MSQLRSVLFVAALPLVACGGGGDSQPDAHVVIVPDAAPDAVPDAAPDAAPMYDFSCEGNSAPTATAATVTISGTAQGVTIAGTSPSVDPLPGATIDFCKMDCTNASKLGTTTSAADGTFSSLPLPTAANNLNGGYVRTAKDTYRTSNVYPANPIQQDVANVPAVTFSNSAFATLAQFFGPSGGQDAAKGDLGLIVTDCSDMPIAGATLTLKQMGADVAGTTVFDLSSLSPQAAGTFIVFNVPPGGTEVGATFGPHTLRAHTVRVVAGQTTATIIRPGF